MPRHGKRYVNAFMMIEPDRLYTPAEAVALLSKFPKTRFDETVETHFRLGIDPRQADQTVRSTVVLPNGTGKEPRVLVFAVGDAARIALESGADHVGSDDLVQRIQEGWLEV